MFWLVNIDNKLYLENESLHSQKRNAFYYFSKELENPKIFKKFNKRLKSTNRLAWTYIILYSLATALMFVCVTIFYTLAIKIQIFSKIPNWELSMYEANLGITVLFLIADDIIVFYILINAILMIALTIKVSLLKKYCRLYCKCFWLALTGIFFSPFSIASSVKLVKLIKKDLIKLQNYKIEIENKNQ